MLIIEQAVHSETVAGIGDAGAGITDAGYNAERRTGTCRDSATDLTTHRNPTTPCDGCGRPYKKLRLKEYLWYPGGLRGLDGKRRIQPQNPLRRDPTGPIDLTAVIDPQWHSRVGTDASYYHFLRNVRAGQDNISRRFFVGHNHHTIWVLGTI